VRQLFRLRQLLRRLPDNAVLKIEGAHGYPIDYDYCKGYGLCVSEYPAGAITMEPEMT
jgi:Pyruvate/2-oxoacid:ferredoxin oxidoreductase delta subunit